MTPAEKIQAIQQIVSTPPDGIWGPKSQAALEMLVAAARVPSTRSSMSATFIAFFPFLMEWEGEVFENDPDDPGGATKYGIDQRSHPGVDIRSLTKEGAMEIYWKEWLEAGCDTMVSPYAEVYFNCAVNMGAGRAREFAATAKGNPERFLDLQEAKYRSIATRGTMRKFLKGWLNRTQALRNRFAL